MADEIRESVIDFATNQARPTVDIAGYVAGDDAKAKQQVISLVESWASRRSTSGR